MRLLIIGATGGTGFQMTGQAVARLPPSAGPTSLSFCSARFSTTHIFTKLSGLLAESERKR